MIPPFEEVAKFHGHVCPGIIFGYRMAVRALTELSTKDGEEFRVIGETGRCPADGVRVVTGCTEENGGLITVDVGKSAFTFVNRKSGRALRIWIKPGLEIAGIDPGWDILRDKLMSGDASDEETREYEMVNARVTEVLMAMPDEAMLIIRPTAAGLTAIGDRAGFILCHACGEKLVRPKSIEIDGKPYCIPCWMQYG